MSDPDVAGDAAGAPVATARFGPRPVLRRLAAAAGSRWVRWGFLAAVVGAGGYAIASEWKAVVTALTGIGPAATLGAAVTVILGLLATLQVWRVLLAGLGSPLPPATAARIFFVGQLGKYLPGSMWPVLAQMELARASSVPRSRTATAAVLTIAISLGAGLLTGLAALPLLGDGYLWVLLAAPLCVAMLHPRVVNAVIAVLLRVTRRPPLPRPLPGRAIAAALLWALLSWLLLGAHVWFLGLPLAGDTTGLAMASIGGFALAWSAGFLVVLAPAGAGVREVLLIAALSTQLDTAQAAAVAVVSRALMSAADLALAGAAAVTTRASTRGPAPQPRPEPEQPLPVAGDDGGS
ncbi:lysylphosphatidylglycerol synthase domain-containing protein [Dactylosporangium sp. NPDC005572]|uniref:lysylphosphatidylglycerol synthase domain-containing protein n=1 Tax=Dactylosporangium sp. NPDC005572 TaxID=3156889 RepID=UPI0033BED3B8